MGALAACAMLVLGLAAPSTAFAVAGVAQSGSGVNPAVSTTTGSVGQTVDGDDGGTGAESIAGPVPNIIITNFSYGDGSVPAGGAFTLGFTFQNMGKVTVSNMVVTVDGGESFAIAGGTNTFYFESLRAGGAMTQSVPMQAVSGATSGAQPIAVSFRYEYVDAGARSSNSSDIKISVPVSQPDRFQVNDPVMPEQLAAGQETTVTMEYVNKGKGDVSNVEATIEGDGVDTAVRTQYLGNVASGGTGQIGFAFTPIAAGDTEVKLRVTYEDSDGQSQTKEYPLTLSVQESMPIDDGMMPDPMPEQSQGLPWWAWVIGVAVLAGVVALVVVLVRRRKRRKNQQADIDEEWDDWERGSDAADAAAKTDDGTSNAAAADDAMTQRLGDPQNLTAQSGIAGGAPEGNASAPTGL